MEYPQITALVPQNEHFDATAMNEGMWLTVAHVNAIESALAASESGATTVATQHQNALTQLNTQLTAATSARDAAQTALVSSQNRVTALESEVAALKKGPAGTVTATTRESDPPPITTTVKNEFETEADREVKKMRAELHIN